MFEVIISQVKTGRVERRQFGTLEEAEQYASQREEKILRPRPNQRRVPSLRDWRIEVRSLPPAAETLAGAAPRSAA
jgi:hypothetical protein